MERWKKINVYVSVAGFVVFLVSLIFAKQNPFVLCLSAFALGVAWKGFKNIYKNVQPPSAKTATDPYDYNYSRNKKKKKKKKKR